MGLDGKVVLLTGASKGIGAAYLTALSQAGATVVGLARSFGNNTEKSDNIVRWHVDVEDEHSVQRCVDQTLAEFAHIDVLINNAGVFPRYGALDISLEGWDEMMRINLRGPYLMIRAVAPLMRERKGGTIVTVSSGSALHTTKGTSGHDGLLAYSVSKAGIDRMTDFLAEELRQDNIAVNALRPGGVLTQAWREADAAGFAAAEASGNATPCTPERVGPPMLFLAQQSAATMTGEVVRARDFGVHWGPKL